MADLVSKCCSAPVRTVYGDGRTTHNHLECSSCYSWVNSSGDRLELLRMSPADIKGALVIFFVVSAVILGGTAVWWRLVQSPPPISASSISPGHATPREAVDGFFQAWRQGNETLACSYASPASRATCSSQISQQRVISEYVALQDAVVSGKFALVEVTGTLCFPGGACESNTNPMLEMPASSASFQQVYDDLVKSTTYTFSPFPCIRVGGIWYINFGP